MIFAQPQALRQRICEVTKREGPIKLNIVEDTSEFMSIIPGNILRLGGNDYLVIGHAREGRFGIDEQPKFWVKTAIDLTTGAKKIIKMVFEETFNGRLGANSFHCFRSPEKEAEVIKKMHTHPNFMHGHSVPDTAGNIVRIIDYISGPSLYTYLRRQKISHKELSCSPCFRRECPLGHTNCLVKIAAEEVFERMLR